MRKPASSYPVIPKSFAQTIKARHTIIKRTRSFFDDGGYLEVQTPIRVTCPGIEAYVDAIPAGRGFYLATSPELQMKRILAAGIPKIYQITHAFRAEELGPLHCPEFLMLEWYRTGTDYLGIMEETEELLQAIIEGLNYDCCRLTFPLPRMSVDDLYYQAAGWRPSVAWDEDRYFSDWVEKVEPVLRLQNGLFLNEFPVALASLSRLKRGQPQICERFELFLHGIEMANAFTELTDYDEHLRRFKDASRRREQMAKEVYPIDEDFMESVRIGIPECAGIALGLDRLIMALLGHSSIENIQTIPPRRP